MQQLAELHSCHGLETEEQSVHPTLAVSSCQGLVEGVGQLQQLTAAAGHDSAQMLNSTNCSRGNCELMTAVDENANGEFTRHRPRDSSTHLQAPVLSRCTHGVDLLSWGSGASDLTVGSRAPGALSARSPASVALPELTTSYACQLQAEAHSNLSQLRGSCESLDAATLMVWGSGSGDPLRAAALE